MNADGPRARPFPGKACQVGFAVVYQRDDPGRTLSAWETYQRGLWFMSKVTPLENEQARMLFQRAAEIDPGFAPPIVGIALTHLRDALHYGIRPISEAGGLIEPEARKAMAIDPNDSEGQAALALAFLATGEMNTAQNYADRALTLNRNSPFAHQVMGGALMHSARPNDGKTATLMARRLNPRDPVSANAASGLPISYCCDHNYVAAVDTATKCLADYPAFAPPRRYLVATLGQLGRRDEAAAALRQFMAVAPDVFDATVRTRPPYVRPEDHEHILEGLRKAGWQARYLGVDARGRSKRGSGEDAFVSDIRCRCRFEKTLFLPVRNVTPGRRTHIGRNGITALRRVRAAGSRAETGAPARAARPLRPSVSPSILEKPCDSQSRPYPRGGSTAARSSRSRSTIDCNASSRFRATLRAKRRAPVYPRPTRPDQAARQPTNNIPTAFRSVTHRSDRPHPDRASEDCFQPMIEQPLL